MSEPYLQQQKEIQNNRKQKLQHFRYVFQITDVIAYLHTSELLLHRDVSPQSILITKTGNWKLAGFGFAEKLDIGKVKAPCGVYSINKDEVKFKNRIDVKTRKKNKK